MATVSGNTTWISRGVHRISWASFSTTASVGSVLQAAHLPDKTVQVWGTFASKGHIRIQGSNNTTTGPWHALNDPQGNALDVTAAKTEQILENPRFMRAILVSGVVTTTKLNVAIVSQSTRR